MARVFFMFVSVACYVLSVAALLYLIGFVGSIPGLHPTVDQGPDAPLATAVEIDVLLIALFGVQHTVMARPGFKQAWTRLIPEPIERSVYCLATVAVLIVLYLFWRPITDVVWHVEVEAWRIVLWTLFGLGWAILLLATFLLNHFELFGLAQPWRHLRGIAPPGDKFRTPALYRVVRHPIYTGIVLAVWSAPTMTVGHFLLAFGFTAYILIAVRYEERDLVARFGDTYVEYRSRVAMLIPGIGRRG